MPPTVVRLTPEELEVAKVVGMTPVEYARGKIAAAALRARRRASALKGWRTRRRRLGLR